MRHAFAFFCVVVFVAASDRPANFDRWTDELAQEWIRISAAAPGSASAATDAAESETADNASDVSSATADRRVALARRALTELAQWSPSALRPQQRISLGVLRWNLEIVVAGEPYRDYQFIFNQMPGGLHVSLVNRLLNRTLRTKRDADDYLNQLRQIAGRLDTGIQRTRAAAQRGILPPRFILDRAGGQLDAILAGEPGDTPLVTTFARRIDSIRTIDARTRADAVATAKQLVADQVRPAYRRVRALFDELRATATDAAGLSRLPNGAAAYAYALRRYTTTEMTAEEVHALGRREVARLEAELDGVLRRLGYTGGSIEDRLGRLSTGAALPATPDARDAVLARYTEIIRDAEKRAAPLFHLKPHTPVEVRREPTLTERTASAHYSGPYRDGSRPGIFWVPLPGPTFHLRPSMRTLAYHEAIPGHHYQIAVMAEIKDLPRFRARRTFGGFAAYSEGWGLYAERLAVEQGWYADDLPGKAGALNAELFRARRLVVDTGLHAKGWSRQQAIDYGIGATEVERYVVNPGQACAYMIGMLHILAEREKARATLGEKFTLPEFHDLLLKTGSVPLGVLTEVVDAWVADRRALVN